MKYRKLIYSLCVILSFGFSNYKIANENERLIAAINSDEFEKCMNVCLRNNDTVKIYNNVNEFLDCPTFKLDCGKTVLIENSNIKIDLNKNNRDEQIILYKFEKLKSRYKFYFIDFPSNGHLVLTLNKNNKSVKFECGVF